MFMASHTSFVMLAALLLASPSWGQGLGLDMQKPENYRPAGMLILQERTIPYGDRKSVV